FSGERARELGLVDSLGGLQDAIGLAGKLAGIEGEPVAVYAKKPRASFFEYLLGDSVEELANNILSVPFYRIGYIMPLGN
ncbi:MAG: signal peptide peptidase SppA, partial [Pseudomonadota bacterium]